jgi:peptide/nickel transport system substrate-binding protein
MFYDIEKTEKIDDYTVKITLSEPNAAMLTSLAMFTTCIVSPASAEKWKEDSFKHPVGTGPFKFVEWVKDDHITLEAFDDYWDGRPKIDKLIFKVIPDPSVRVLSLEKGEIQGMEYPNPEHLKGIRNNPNLKLLEQPGMNVGYLAMNCWNETPGFEKPFGDKRVRQAINHAINKEEIIKYLYKGTAIVAKNPMPPCLWGYNDEIQDYEYNPEKAKELLAEAGYPDGFETTLWVMPVSRPYMFDPSKIAEAIQADLANVGIKAEIYQVEWGTYLEKTEAGEHPMCLLGWTGDNGDPDNFLNVLLGKNSAIIGSSGNHAFYRDDDVQELLTKALRTYDEGERVKLYEQAQVIIHEDAPWVCLAHANQILAFREDVYGFTLHPTSRKFFYHVWYGPEE